jgi:AraC-like DNA-binding protein
LHQDARARDRLAVCITQARRIGLIGDGSVCEEWGELLEWAAQGEPVIAIFDPYSAAALDMERIRSITALPRVLPIAYGDFAGKMVGVDVAELLSAGVGRIWSLGAGDTTEVLLEDMASLGGEVALRSLVARLTPHLRRRQAMVFVWAFRVEARGLSLAELAQAKGVSVRSLRRWFGAAPLGPGEVVRWARLLRTTALLNSTGASLATVVRWSGYSRITSFQRAYWRLVGRSAIDIQQEELHGIAESVLLQLFGASRTAERDCG